MRNAMLKDLGIINLNELFLLTVLYVLPCMMHEDSSNHCFFHCFALTSIQQFRFNNRCTFLFFLLFVLSIKHFENCLLIKMRAIA